MSHTLGINRWNAPVAADGDRRYRSSRVVYDRMLDQAGSAERQRMAGDLAAAARANPAMAQGLQRIEARRARMTRRGELLALGGAVAIIGLVATLCMTSAPLMAQAAGILVGAMGLAAFRLALIPGRQMLNVQLGLQLVAALLLLNLAALGADMLLPGAIACLGLCALGLREVQLSAARQLDIDEVELVMAAQGRQTVWAVREDRQRRIAAAI